MKYSERDSNQLTQNIEGVKCINRKLEQMFADAALDNMAMKDVIS